MRGVTFNEEHSYQDWGLMLASKPVVSPPKPKIKLIQVPGSDKIIDLTQHLTGDVHYEPRTITFEFVTCATRDTWDGLQSEILMYLHGQSVEITLDDDPDWYYVGRVTVGDMNAGKKTATIPMTATVEPYKRAHSGEGRSL